MITSGVTGPVTGPTRNVARTGCNSAHMVQRCTGRRPSRASLHVGGAVYTLLTAPLVEPIGAMGSMDLRLEGGMAVMGCMGCSSLGGISAMGGIRLAALPRPWLGW
mmetsp:Transcript_5461/g.15615  ORF Transcript_5461/g.15615 Transcript_5461/m.15615 type:complete len:106 (-) Transcript_5461:1621-1938(-)